MEFDPETHREPLGPLAEAVKALRAGQSVRLPDGTRVRAAAVKHGGMSRRVFQVGSGRSDKTVRVAAEAARLALASNRRRSK